MTLPEDRTRQPLKPVSYVIDVHDALVALNDEWSTFARQNAAPELIPEAIIGRSIWSFVSGPETQTILRSLLDGVRSGLTAQFPFRCDSPTMVRRMLMRMRPMTGRQVEFVSTVTAQFPVSYKGLWDSTVPRTDQTLVACSWCKRVLIERTWRDAATAIATLMLFDRSPLPRISHGLCHDCERMLREIARRD